MSELIEVPQGAFEQNLRLNGKEIRDKRARNLSEDAKLAYKTKVDRLLYDYRRLVRDQEDSLDMSPDNVFSFVNPKDFDPEKFAEGDSDLTLRIRNAKIKLLGAALRYKYLFGEEIDLPNEFKQLMEKEIF